MSEEKTLREAERGLPIQALEVEVLHGAQRGERASATGDTLSIGSAEGNDLVLRDPRVSRYHLSLRRVARGVQVQDCGSTNGTYVGTCRIERGIVPSSTRIKLGETEIALRDGALLTLELSQEERLGGLLGRSEAMRRLMIQLRQAAQGDAPMLLIGESGTGKEVAAQVLHEQSRRRAGPFVTVDCASLLPTLVASELFGHEQGAFTGAVRTHVGAFERAHGGTLFLDEIGELPEQLQPALLGALERRRFRRLGGKRDISIDVRIVAATHRDLRRAVNEGSFRLDLFYRLAVVMLEVPPLRERRDDIEPLIEHFLELGGHSGGVRSLLSDSVLSQLERYHFPGNVRELRNFVESTLVMGTPPALSGLAASQSSDDFLETLLTHPYGEARSALLERFEKRYLEQLLERHAGNVSKAAREADMNRSHLNDLLRRHRLR